MSGPFQGFAVLDPQYHPTSIVFSHTAVNATQIDQLV